MWRSQFAHLTALINRVQVLIAGHIVYLTVTVVYKWPVQEDFPKLYRFSRSNMDKICPDMALKLDIEHRSIDQATHTFFPCAYSTFKNNNMYNTWITDKILSLSRPCIFKVILFLP